MFRSANVLGYKSHILYMISSEFTTIVVGGSWPSSGYLHQNNTLHDHQLVVESQLRDKCTPVEILFSNSYKVKITKTDLYQIVFTIFIHGTDNVKRKFKKIPFCFSFFVFKHLEEWFFCGNMEREITRNPNLDHSGSYFIKPRLQAVPLFQQSPLFESRIVTEKALMLAIKLVRFLDYTIFFFVRWSYTEADDTTDGKEFEYYYPHVTVVYTIHLCILAANNFKMILQIVANISPSYTISFIGGSFFTNVSTNYCMLITPKSSI